MPADLRLTADRLTAIDSDEAAVALDADLAFTGRLPDYRLAGTVTVLPSEIRIPEQLPPSVIELDVTEVRDGVIVRRSEEHTSELQSLMRISYAVFCLKKKKITHTQNTIYTNCSGNCTPITT